MESSRLPVDDDLVVFAKSFTVEEGVRCSRLLLDRGAGCTAIAAGNDMPFIDRLRPPLTTIRFPHYQVGTEAAQLLLERIAEHSGPVKILYLAPELVVRGSTARARISG